MMDQELQACMEELYQRQQKCLRIQKRLIIATMVLFVFAFPLLFVHILITMFWGNQLAREATAMARKRYPYVSIGAGYGNRGLSWDLKLMSEAAYFDDIITIKILKFNRTSTNYFIFAILGCISVWIFVAILKEISVNLLQR